MRARTWVAAATGTAGAVIAHALDVAGRLPFVHESEVVRTGLGPVATGCWLLAAAVIGAVASRRPMSLGAAGAIVVAGAPELIARHDPGAIVEPGAFIGALMQWMLLLLVIAVALAVEAQLFMRPLTRGVVAAAHRPPPSTPSRIAARRARCAISSRAPPALSFSHPT
jgi:hypothetical protein